VEVPKTSTTQDADESESLVSDVEDLNDSLQLPNAGREVAFGNVTIREYARSVGDNPSVGAGPPIGLDWAYSSPTVVPVDYFETSLRKEGQRTRKDFYLTPEQRFHMLLDDWSCSMEEITQAKKDAAHIRYLRHTSLFGVDQTSTALANRPTFDRRTPPRESLKGYRLPRLPGSPRASKPSIVSLDP
jgi:hypothetical protein